MEVIKCVEIIPDVGYWPEHWGFIPCSESHGGEVQFSRDGFSDEDSFFSFEMPVQREDG